MTSSTNQNTSHILVLGGGESGFGAALLAHHRKFQVLLSDKGRLQSKYREPLAEAGILFEEGTHTLAEQWLRQAQEGQIQLEIIKSPGIPDKVPLIQQALAIGIPIISEIEFGARYTQAIIVAITGSNGKTTTATLIHHLMQQAGLSVGLGGNIGESFAKQVIDDPYPYWVLEVSSFQLDNCFQFRPKVAVLLNITPDHLDRYDYVFERYIDSKFRICQAQQADDYFIYSFESKPIVDTIRQRGDLEPYALPFMIDKPEAASPTNRAFVADGQIIANVTLHAEQSKFSFPVNELTIKGKHNLSNAMAAILACQALDVKPEKIVKGLKTFRTIEHRLEEVATIRGVKFYNDSKATNVDAVYYALEAFARQKGKIIWIAGGTDKGNDYAPLLPLVRGAVSTLVCLGLDNEKLVETFSPHIPHVHQTTHISEAVSMAYAAAQPGDIVLLSPACASFDLFKNYEDRGRQFKQAVKALYKRQGETEI